MAVLGVDGCPGGWVGALLDGRVLSWHTGSFAELLALPAAAVGVDIPIGLPDGAERRAADVEARALLGPQRSSVFYAPPRVVLEAGSQPEATALSRAAGSVGVSIQMFHILGKVAEVDALLRAAVAPCPPAATSSGSAQIAVGAQAPRGGGYAREPAGERVVEVHPEVSLRRLCGRALPPKRSLAGRTARLEVLRRWMPDLELPSPLPGRARPDDCLDAVAAAWSAQRWAAGRAEVLGGDLDGAGLPMRIVV